MDDLDQRLRDFYQSRQLSSEKLARLGETLKVVRPWWWRRPSIWAAAALIGLCLFGLAWFFPWDAQRLNRQIAAEVAKSSAKGFKPEVRSHDWEAIQEGLERIQFPLAPTQPQLLAGYEITGGRYCSIQGEVAAQIALTDPQGESCTLFIAPLTPRLSPSRPGTMRQAGTDVQLWHDGHRLYALVRKNSLK